MNRTPLAHIEPIDIEEPLTRRMPRATRATWAPAAWSSPSSFLPWEEMIEPRFPKPPRMPHDLKAPKPRDAALAIAVFGDDIDDLDTWLLDP